MKRIHTKIGDVFVVKLENGRKKYFQLVVFDLTQLNSDVIRVFKTSYSEDNNCNLSEIINDEVDFYAHCVTKWGIQLGFWEKVGKSLEVGNNDVLFRSSSDDPKTKILDNWWIWKVNEQQQYVGKLEGENRLAEIGSIIPPDSIVYRINTGKYDFVYPEFE
ncbi:immunity 26/phosphotriesterase HocA family protein [Acinetobacter baumannii]|nr:immunity 26/phosphotriesterase HocA family protein [Acinetobacter baumannii]